MPLGPDDVIYARATALRFVTVPGAAGIRHRAGRPAMPKRTPMPKPTPTPMPMPMPTPTPTPMPTRS